MEKVLVLILFGSWGIAAAQRPAPRPAADQNFSDCRSGLSGCNISALDPSENKLVSEASHKRNMDHCLDGLTLCDPTRLTATEAASVQAARYRRNLEKCLVGAAACDPFL